MGKGSIARVDINQTVIANLDLDILKVILSLY